MKERCDVTVDRTWDLEIINCAILASKSKLQSTLYCKAAKPEAATRLLWSRRTREYICIRIMF